MAIINLSAPIGREKRRGFQPPWYTVFVYLCKECNQKTYVRANSFRGIGSISAPEPQCRRNYLSPLRV